MSLKIGESDLISASVGDLDIKSIWVGEDLVWQPPNYLCFTAQEAGSTISMTLESWSSKGQAFEYSTNAATWNTFTPGTTTITLSKVGDRVYFRGDNVTVSESSSQYYQFVMSGTIAASGNIMSLLDSTCQSTTISHEYCFAHLFESCSSLTSAPELPATILSNGCYYSLFHYCRNLTVAPELPATSLAIICYRMMFRFCTSLKTAPLLPATALAEGCYESMFDYCTSLTTPPALPATTLAYNCYSEMFEYCTSLLTAPALPATTLEDNCYYRMFCNCESLTTPPALPATTLTYECYSQMFSGCTSLTTAPALPATTLADYCYACMFDGCQSLTTAPALPATFFPDSCYECMFALCENLQVSDNATSEATCVWRIPASGSWSRDGFDQFEVFDDCPGTRSSDHINLWNPDLRLYQIYYTQNPPVS